jgi:hypothetical protein
MYTTSSALDFDGKNRVHEAKEICPVGRNNFSSPFLWPDTEMMVHGERALKNGQNHLPT